MGGGGVGMWQLGGGGSAEKHNFGVTSEDHRVALGQGWVIIRGQSEHI